MSTSSSNLGLTLAVVGDIVSVAAHIADNFALLDTKWSTAGTPAAVQVGATGTPGSSTVVSRSDHIHGIVAGTPVSTATANSAGSNTTVAASDHVHKVGDLSVPTAAMQLLSVTTAIINDLAVTAAKVATNAITTVKLLDLSVTTAKINDLAVTTGKIALLAVDTAQIAAGAITDTKLGTQCVTSDKLWRTNNPANDDVLTYTSLFGQFKWQAVSSLVTVTPADDSITVAKLEPVAKPLVGAIEMFGGSSMTTPNARGWYLCDGTTLNSVTHSALWGVIGTTYGAGTAGTTFTLPDMRGRFPIGKSGTYALGATGGVDTLPNHTHTFGGGAVATGASQQGSQAEYDEDDTGNGHNVFDKSHTHPFSGTTANPGTNPSILNPYLSVQFIIYSGVAS